MTKTQKLRERQGITAYRLAKISGVSYPAVLRLERGQTTRPHPGTLALLAAALQVPMDSLR